MRTPYLRQESAYGCAYAFDPDSAVLREALLHSGRYRTEPISSAALIEDLPFLRRLLEIACAGYDELCRHSAFDPDVFFATWADNVRRGAPLVSSHDAVVEPLRRLRRIIPNGHLTIAGLDALISADPSGRFLEYQTHGQPPTVEAVAADLPAYARADTLRTAPVLHDHNIQQLTTVSATGERDAIVAGQFNLVPRPTNHGVNRNGPQRAYDWNSLGDTGVITLSSFQTGRPEIRAQLETFVADFDAHSSHRRLVFDLRGNGGGDLDPIRQWLARACPKEWQSWAMVEIMGPIAVCKGWNWAVEWQIRNGTVDTAEASEERRVLAGQWESLAASNATVDKSSSRVGHGERRIASAIYAVVDRNSGSSGELAAIELRNALGAVIIGERTAGACAMGQAARFVLPMTGLVVQVPTQWALFDRAIEGVGWPVDVYLDDIACPAEVIASDLPLLDEMVARQSTIQR